MQGLSWILSPGCLNFIDLPLIKWLGWVRFVGLNSFGLTWTLAAFQGSATGRVNSTLAEFPLRSWEELYTLDKFWGVARRYSCLAITISSGLPS